MTAPAGHWCIVLPRGKGSRWKKHDREMWDGQEVLVAPDARKDSNGAYECLLLTGPDEGNVCWFTPDVLVKVGDE